MTLIPTGEEHATETGVGRLGHDAENNRVVVRTTFEAVDDYGWRTIWGASETKYLKGEYEQNGDTRLVKVTTTDCADEDEEE